MKINNALATLPQTSTVPALAAVIPSAPAAAPAQSAFSARSAAPLSLAGASAHSQALTSPSTDALFHAADGTGAVNIPPEVAALAAKNGFGPLVTAEGAAGTLYCSFQGGLIEYSNVLNQVRDVAPNDKAPAAPLSAGATGDEVCRLQRALGALGFMPMSHVDASYDAGTQAAVKALQQDRGLPVTGNYDAATAKAAQALLEATVIPPAQNLSIGAKGAGVALLQRELTMLGFSTGGVDGDFGPKTQAALKSFQKARLGTADGVFGAQTRSQMAGELPQVHLPPDAYAGWLAAKGLPGAVSSVAGELSLGNQLGSSTVNGLVHTVYQHGVIVSDPTLLSIDTVSGTGFEDLPGSIAIAAANYGLGALQGSNASNGHVTFQFAHGSAEYNLATNTVEGIQQA